MGAFHLAKFSEKSFGIFHGQMERYKPKSHVIANEGSLGRFPFREIFENFSEKDQKRLETGKNCQMERDFSGIFEFSTFRTTSRGSPEFSKMFFGNVAFHLYFSPKFSKILLNGK